MLGPLLVSIGYYRCVTFWEDCGPLAAVLCESLALIGGAGACAARIAKKKSLTHNTIMSSSADRDIPHFPRTYLYGSPAYQVFNAKDIQKYWRLLQPEQNHGTGKQYNTTTVRHDSFTRKVSKYQ